MLPTVSRIGRGRRLPSLELGDRGEETSIHVHAVVGVPDGGVELGEEVAVAHALGRAPDPAARTRVRAPAPRSPAHLMLIAGVVRPYRTTRRDFAGGYGDAQDDSEHRTEF